MRVARISGSFLIVGCQLRSGGSDNGCDQAGRNRLAGIFHVRVDTSGRLIPAFSGAILDHFPIVKLRADRAFKHMHEHCVYDRDAVGHARPVDPDGADGASLRHSDLFRQRDEPSLEHGAGISGFGHTDELLSGFDTAGLSPEDSFRRVE